MEKIVRSDICGGGDKHLKRSIHNIKMLEVKNQSIKPTKLQLKSFFDLQIFPMGKFNQTEEDVKEKNPLMVRNFAPLNEGQRNCF